MRLKRLFAVLMLVAMATGILVATSAGQAIALSGEESQFVSSHNSIRAEHGLRTLSVAGDLVSVARAHSADMARSESIWHNPNLANEVSGWTVLGENVGMGPSVQGLMDAFMNSTEHRDNILDWEYNQIGVGVSDRDGTIYVTVVFARRNVSAPVVQSPRPRHRATSNVGSPASAPVAKPKPKAKPRPAVRPRNVAMLIQILNLDAAEVNPANGRALGV